jgi:uncharacterized protein with beta-barrel porin domain
MGRLGRHVLSIRLGNLREFSRVVFACAVLFGIQSASAQDVIITTPTTQGADYTVNGNLTVVSDGSLNVSGSLHVVDDITNNGQTTGIDVSGNLLAEGDVFNKNVRNFFVRGVGASSVTGELQNLGTFTFGHENPTSPPTYEWAELRLGTLTNEAGAYLLFLPKANLSVTGPINNAGDVTFQLADVQIEAGQTLDNSGTWNLTQGTYTNRGTTSNAAGGVISLSSGAFSNWNQVTNNGIINVMAGNFDNQTGGTMSGNGLLSVNGTATFYQGSMLQGNPTITATLLNLQGTAAPGGDGTVGQMTFDATTHFQGTVLFDLVTPGNPGVGSDLIQITGGHTGTIETGSLFDFHTASAAKNVGDKYEIIRGNIALDIRPVVTDDAPADNRRIVLRTDQDVNGFSNQGTAYYALVARDESFEQLARDNGGKGNEITFGHYLDQFLPQDDHSIGTTNADLQWIRDTLDLMPNEANVVRALGQMSGEVYAPLATIALQRQFFAYSQFAGRLRGDLFPTFRMEQLEGQDKCDGALGATNALDDNSAWVTGYGFGGSLAGDSNAFGCSYGGGGVQAAEGSQITKQLGYGLLYDFGAFGLTNDLGDKAESQAHSFGGYLTWRRDEDYFIFIGSGGFADYHATRYIEFESLENVVSRTAQGKTHGGQAAFYGEYGLNVQWENANLRPYLGLLYMNVLQKAFQETGAGALNLSFEDSSINSFRTLLGSQLDFRYSPASNYVWSLRGVWMHEYINDATAGTLTAGLTAIPDSRFSLTRPTTGGDWFVTGVGVQGAFFSRHVRPFANFDLMLNTRQSLYAGISGIEFVW